MDEVQREATVSAQRNSMIVAKAVATDASARGSDPARLSDVAAALAQQAATAQIGQLALQERSLETLLDDACALVAQILDTEFSSVAELARDGSAARVIAGVGWPGGTVGQLDLGTGVQSQAGFTLATGEPVIVADYQTEQRFRVVDVLIETGVRSGISVRIGGADAPFGTLAVFTTRRVRFTADDANFLRAVANVLAAAVGRLKIEEELRASRDQLAAIVSTIDEGITVRDGQRLIYANDEAARLTGYRDAADLLGATDVVLGKFEIFDESGQPMATDDLPSRRAWTSNESAEAVVGFRIPESGVTRWSQVRAIAVHERSGKVSHVVNIFRDISDERWQREAGEYMADAVAVLSSTLDTDEAAQRLADLSVPRLADYVTVSLLQPDGSIKLVALAHVNPERIALIRELEQMLPPTDPEAAAGSAHVIRDNVIETGTVTPEIIDSLPFPEDQRSLLQRLELRGYVTVPLTGRTKPIGALSLAMAESGRHLQPREIELAKELGARAGIALENARLFQSADARRGELDAVLAALSDSVLVFDGSGALGMGNDAAQTTFSRSLPQTLDELWMRVNVASEDDVAGSDQPLGDEVPLEAEVDGRGQWFEVRRYRATPGAAPEATNEIEAPIVIVLRDITDERAARAARDAFMGVLSHELRTPITTIYGGSELLMRDLDEERRADVIADIRAESERLARLVEDLLVMTRVERGIVEIADEPILLQHLLAAVITSAGARWPGARLTLHAADRLPAVRGDATYVEQVVRNLLTNAVRYGRGLEEGIDIVAEEAPTEVIVRVLDSGNGFGHEDPDRLFELFYRSSSARSVPGGAGIGLFVCRNLIEKMDGRIWASEREEGGAEFGFSLPIVESDAAF